MLGTTNGEHRKLIGVKTVSLFGYGVQFVLLGCCQCFRIWCAARPTKSSKVCIAMHLWPAMVPYQALTKILCGYRAGVLERRCGETFYTWLSSRASPFLRYTGVPPQISSLKPVFQRGKYEEYILYTTRRGAVSGVTLKSSSYVFLACSIWCQL